MTNTGNKESIRHEVRSYTDRNDGFERSHFSRSKNNHSRNTKAGKVARVKAPWKI
jgi:hypothetical protein